MRGMTIGIFNHAMHDSNNVIAYSHDKNGNIRGKISEVVVKPSRYTSCALIDVAANLNTFIDGAGASMKENGGNSTFGSNYRLYWHTANERGFYGNQYVRTTKIVYIGGRITKATGPVGFVMSTYDLYESYQLDGGQIQTVGYNTIRTTADIAGGWVGGWAGLKLGESIGASLGGIPGAVIGGVIVGIGGSLGGSVIGTFSVDKAYGL